MAIRNKTKAPTTPVPPTPYSETEDWEIRTLDPLDPQMLSKEEKSRMEAWASISADLKAKLAEKKQRSQ